MAETTYTNVHTKPLMVSGVQEVEVGALTHGMPNNTWVAIGATLALSEADATALGDRVEVVEEG